MRLPATSAFLKGVLYISGGSAFGQLLVLMATPILARLYSPSDFGVFAVFAAVLAVMVAVSCLRYELSIPIPEDDREAALNLYLCLFSSFFIAMVLGLGVFFWGADLLEKLKWPIDLKWLLWLFPIGAMLGGWYLAFNYWAVRVRSYESVAKSKVIQSLLMLAVQCGGYVAGVGALAVGQVVGQCCGFFVFLRKFISHPQRKSFDFSWAEITIQARKNYRFPLFSSWSALLNSVGLQIPNVLLVLLFDPAVAGLYFMASRVVSAPMTILGQAVGQAFYSEAAEAARTGRLEKLSWATVKRLSLVALLPLVGVVVLAPSLLPFILGAEWQDVGVVAQCLTLTMAAQFVTSPVSQILVLRNKQALSLFMQLLLTLLKVAGLLLGYWLQSYILAILCFSIFSAVGYVLYLAVSLYCVREEVVV